MYGLSQGSLQDFVLFLRNYLYFSKVTCVCSMEIPNASEEQYLKSDCLFSLCTEEGKVILLAIYWSTFEFGSKCYDRFHLQTSVVIPLNHSYIQVITTKLYLWGVGKVQGAGAGWTGVKCGSRSPGCGVQLGWKR